jgi:catechol 2,3-dioxygenase-like lactoylglutathione lyase family enzyme
MNQARWHHVGLAVQDLAASIAFYEAMFEFSVRFQAKLADDIASITGETGLTCELAQLARDGGMVLELLEFPTSPTNNKPIYPGTAHVSFAVADLDAALGKLEHLGGKRLGKVVVFSEGKSAYCTEPGGSFLELEEFFEEEHGQS